MNAKAKVLIIDDEDVICKGCTQILEKDGFEVDYARDGIIGLAKLHDKEHDIVLIDLMMPQIKGTQVLESIQKFDPNIKIIVITGYATEEIYTIVLEKGAFDYLAKPFTAEELRNVVSRAMCARRNTFPKLSA